AVSELGDSSVNFVFRAWVETKDYWDVYFEMLEKVKLKFDEKGISIPYPQMDVHTQNIENKT
ncbi:MAG: mechanosensitive ion channel, partial [Sulfurimonas sp.]|nr:mechanosensitive ion channel [Sulfurimonas sp.]